MPVVVVGVSARDVPLDVLGSLAIGDDELPKALRELTDGPNCPEAVVLSTCLRVEVYAAVERFHDGVADIEAFFARRAARSGGAGGALVAERLSCRFDDAAVAHLFEVAAGIDSPVLGEGEVLRQVRAAAQRAQDEGAAGPVLGALFRHAVEAGKRVRTETGIARGITSIAHAAVALAEERAGGTMAGKHAAVLGAGEVATRVVDALSVLPGVGLSVLNRTPAHAAGLAQAGRGRALGLDALPAVLRVADVVFSATGAAEPVVREDDLEEAVRGRDRARPLLVVDLALPRDVEASARGLAGVDVLDLDDVRAFVDVRMDGRRREVERVRALLDEELERYRLAAAGRLAAPVVAALRARAEAVRREELERAGVATGQSAALSADAVERLTRRIVAKLLHEPTVRLKQEAGTPRGERLAEALRTLFDL